MSGLRRIVAPQRWSEMNRVEHPPLMMKQLVQGVCGGLRWLETKNLAEYMASRAIKEGFPASRSELKAFGIKKRTTLKRKQEKQQQRSRSSSPSRMVAPNSSSSSGKDLMLTSSSNALAPALVTKQRRLISYDVLDCTLGGGYHSGAVLENGKPYSRVIALDCDAAVTATARELSREFGSERFRFYRANMSDAKSMFGERSFDAVIIDPGPSVTQLEDPERGFLLDDENHHCFDMRYSPCSGNSALEYLNSVSQHTLANALRSYSILTPEQSMKLARAVRVAKPITTSDKLLEIIQAGGDELPEEGWGTQQSRRKTPMSWKFLTTVRCIVNNEMREFQQALTDSLLMLREDGRLVVFSRLTWEEELIKKTVNEHPHALLSYSEKVDISQVEQHGHSRHTIMWVVTRVQQSSYVLKNSYTLTEEKVQESALRWTAGMFAGQTHAFPAHNFTFENMDTKEWKVKKRNEQPPAFDWDDDDTR